MLRILFAFVFAVLDDLAARFESRDYHPVSQRHSIMQRWWFPESKTKLQQTSSLVATRSIASVEAVDLLREWTFRVFVRQPLSKFEAVGVTGECAALGDWQPHAGVELINENGDTNIWAITVSLPDQRTIPYRFFIYSKDPNSDQIHIRRWETHLKPRKVPAYNIQEAVDINTFGVIDGIEKLDGGWLTTETIFQFKFFNNPFHLKEKLTNRLIQIKLTPINLRISENSATKGSNDGSLSTPDQHHHSSYALAEVVTLKYPHSIIETQEQFGRAYYPDDIVIFNVTVAEPDNIAYLIDLYTYSSSHVPGEPPVHLGYHYVLPNMLRRSDGELEIPITCATKHRPLGMMSIEFLKITPLQNSTLSMKTSYSRHWNKKWTGLDVGHRGSGNSFKGDANIRENTIASIKKAQASGADMVEFDVQLSKDLVPVIYHDFIVCVSLKKKRQLTDNDMMRLPMKDLTMEQLSNLKVYHTVEGKTGAAKFFDEDLEEHQPFPKLADALDIIDKSVGFNIEIKWSMLLKDGTLEMDSSIDRNLYVDKILDVVLAKPDQRRIVFSCFDPDICTMVRFKQNLYPVMLLTQGVSLKYPRYHDPRCNTIESAVSNACAMELLGIVAHTEDLLRNSSQINLVTDLGLIIFCWGDDNNSQDAIRMLKTKGIHGIIYDKIYDLNTKDVKKSVFLVDSNGPKSDVLHLQELEKGF